MDQHDKCNSYYEDFERKETLFQPCELCKLLDNRVCYGGSHKRKDTGIVIDAQFNIAAVT